MALSVAVADTHISSWTDKLAKSSYPFTAKWPRRIFRHDPLENVAEILNSGEILSRSASTGRRIIDAAEEEIVNSTDRAHQRVRMYFRPRTPTQYHMEGIRKVAELYGNAHAPTLAMMIFDAKTLLTNEGVEFSTCNMQSPYARTGSDDEFFASQMDFSKIFHHGPHDRDDTITRCRCAEVLVPSPLSVAGTLQYIYWRSQAEFETLVYMLTPEAESYWRPRIRVSDDMKVFEKRFSYVENVSISNEGLSFQLAPRRDGASVEVQIRVRNTGSGELVMSFANKAMQPIPPSRRWIIRRKFEPGNYAIDIDVEGHAAYRTEILYEEQPF